MNRNSKRSGRQRHTFHGGALTRPIAAPDCALCGEYIRTSWVRHDGLPVHAACWSLTGDAPDSIRGVGLFAIEAVA